MVNLINLEQVNKSFGITPLLDDVSLGVQEGERIGVVGLNGGGKTTLLEVLTGIEQPDGGRVSRMNGLRLAVVTQRGVLPEGATVGEVVLAGLADDHMGWASRSDSVGGGGRATGGPDGVAEHEWAANSRIRTVIEGIGIAGLGLDTPVATLSGGERRRVALAAALVRELDLLVLDEPTNHLDVEGVQWLAEHLLARRSALVVVTHDRWFLDIVATRTWEVVGGKVESYEGGYNDWIFARAERVRQADATEARRRNLARKELAWLRRGPQARTSKPRYRVEAAEALIADVPAPRDTVELAAFARKRLGRVVIELEDVTLCSPTPPPSQAPSATIPGSSPTPPPSQAPSATIPGSTPGDRELVRDLTWRLAPGERVGLVGVNGSGKTTLLRALAGDGDLATGKRIQGQTIRIGWLRQELDDLPVNMRVLQAISDVAERIMLGDKEVSAGQMAERLGFSPARQRTPVGDLSGGERRRLQLTRILMSEPNVLLLDEPTNDLDIDTLQQLEDLLDGWAGTLVVISHDRYLIERICDSTWALFGDGKLTNLPGGIEEYLRKRAALAAAAGRPVISTTGRASSATGSTGAGGEANSPAPATDSAAYRAARKEFSRLERSLEKLTEREERLHTALAEAATDPDRLVGLGAELEQVQTEKNSTEERWLELAEEVG